MEVCSFIHQVGSNSESKLSCGSVMNGVEAFINNIIISGLLYILMV